MRSSCPASCTPSTGGIPNENRPDQMQSRKKTFFKKNRFVNRLTVIMGVFTGKPTVAGAGLLAQAKEEDFLAWQKIQKIKYKPKSQTILLRGHPGQKIAVFCPPDYYQQIEDFIKEHVKSKQNRE